MSVEKTSPAQEANTMQSERKIYADINSAGDTYITVTLSGEGVLDLTEPQIEAALSTDAEPVKTAPAVAVKALKAWEAWEAKLILEGSDDLWEELGDLTDLQALRNAALSAQVQDVAGWIPIGKLRPDHGEEVFGWIKVCGKFCAHPIYYSAFSRTWRRKLDGIEVEDVTHYQPLLASPASKHGDAE